MTRLSDLLRGAADRAPIGEASVSIRGAHRRIRIQRGIRGAANGLAGAGAAALIVFGIINPTVVASRGGDQSALAPVPVQEDGGKTFGSDSADLVAYNSNFWGSCGATLYDDLGDTSEALALSIGSDGLYDLEGGASVDIPIGLAATGDLEVRTAGPEAVLLYEGIVVARLDAVEAEQVLDLTSGDIVDSTLSFPLVNCFDGAPLPAAKYELVVSQGFAAVDPDPEPTPEPSWTPLPEPSPVPLPEPSPLPPIVDDSLGASSIAIMPEPDGNPDIMPIAPSRWDSREVAPSVTVSIAGDPVDDPFGDYIWSPPERPTDILTPEKARELYAAGLISGSWDMAPGTSRWIIPNYDSYPMLESSTIAAPNGWYGCSWDGSTGLTFPTESAVLDLLQVSVTAPSALNVSYGWVVDGNPEIHFSVTNTSAYSLPGFYGQPSSSLYLVKDGRVVAQAYPQSMYPYSGDIVYATSSTDDASTYWGTLSPNATLTGDYLWRDLNGCWTDSGPGTVTAGTYTLVTSQSIYVDNSTFDPYPIMYSDTEIAAGSTGTGIAEPGLTRDSQDTGMIVDPSPSPNYIYDSVELQVWTSLGTVTIATD